MKYIAVENNKLFVREAEIPAISDNQLLIKICYAGVNRADIFQREGLYKPPAGVTEILGLEISGFVEKTGKNIKDFQVGDKVCAILKGGGYAEYAVAEESSVIKLSEKIGLREAAAIPESFFTCYHAIFNKAKAKKSETILIHGGSSGIGYTAIQLAKNYGMKVFSTVSSEEKCKFIKEIGADIAINYTSENFEEICKSAGGVDIVIDMVGGDYTQKNFSVLKNSGRLVILGFIKGAKSELNLAPLLLKDLSIFSFRMRAVADSEKNQIRDKIVSEIMPLIPAQKIKIIIDSEFNFREAEYAHELMKSSKHKGKIILKVS